MDATTPPRTTRTFGASSINIILGIWLIIAPFVLGYTGLAVAMWNDIILGLIVGVIALIRTFSTAQSGASWINVVAGIWLIIAPFVLKALLKEQDELVTRTIVVTHADRTFVPDQRFPELEACRLR